MLTFNVKCEKLVVCIDFLPHFYDRILHIARPFRWFFSFFFGGWFNWNGLTSPILPLFSKCLLFHLALNVFFFSLIHSILSNQCEILCVVTNIHGDRMFGFDFVFPSSNFDARPPADIADFNWVLCYFFVDWLGKTSTTNDVNLVFFFHIFLFVCSGLFSVRDDKNHCHCQNRIGQMMPTFAAQGNFRMEKKKCTRRIWWVSLICLAQRKQNIEYEVWIWIYGKNSIFRSEHDRIGRIKLTVNSIIIMLM